MTLKQLEECLIISGEAKKSVEFYDHEGGRLAYGTKLKNVLELSCFKMNIDVSLHYHCRSLEGFSE